MNKKHIMSVWDCDSNEEPHVNCDHCGAVLWAATDTRDGDEAYRIDGAWYCEDCLDELFREEVTVDDPYAI